MMTSNEWIVAARIHLPMVEKLDLASLGSDSAMERCRNLIRATEAMCARCEAQGIHYDALSDLVHILTSDTAVIERGVEAIRRAHRDAELVVRRLASLEKVDLPNDSAPPSQDGDGISATKGSSTVKRPPSGKVQCRREAMLRALPASNKPPMKDQTALRQALTRQTGGLDVDSTTISRDVKHLVTEGLAEQGMLRRTPLGDRRVS